MKSFCRCRKTGTDEILKVKKRLQFKPQIRYLKKRQRSKIYQNAADKIFKTITANSGFVCRLLKSGLNSISVPATVLEILELSEVLLLQSITCFSALINANMISRENTTTSQKEVFLTWNKLHLTGLRRQRATYGAESTNYLYSTLKYKTFWNVTIN